MRPYKIVKRISDAVYDINVSGSVHSVSTDLLKPAFFLLEDVAENSTAVKTQSLDTRADADIPPFSVV